MVINTLTDATERVLRDFVTQMIVTLKIDINKFESEYGILINQERDTYGICRDYIWNHCDEVGIVSMYTKDNDAIEFVTEQVDRLTKMYNKIVFGK